MRSDLEMLDIRLNFLPLERSLPMGTRRFWFPVSASVFGSMLISGCLPAPMGAYYLPSYADPSMRATKAYCGGQVGPTTGLKASLAPGVELAVDARKATSSAPTIDLKFDLEPGVSFKFLDDAAQVGAGDALARQALPLRVFQQLSIPADETVDLTGMSSPMAKSGPQSAEPAANIRTGWLQSPVDLRSGRLILRWPDLQWADGRATSFADIELEAETRSGWTVYRSAQELARLKAAHEKCVKDTPKNQCGNILDAYQNGFTVQADGVTMTGRLLVTELTRPRLDAYIGISLSRAQRWRWSEPRAVLVDAGSGATTQQPLDTMHVSVNMAGLPLSTSVLASPAASAITSAYLVASLDPAGARRYRVQLPPLEVDGRRVDPPPIELERRLLDVGIVPFNC